MPAHNRQVIDIPTTEFERLEGLVEARDTEIGRLTDEWNACLAEVERLKPIGHTATCACQLCLRAYGPVETRSS